ncbi:SNF2 family domain-containing protein [Fusarium mexicanum]|uniref:SNF2 family domain-containing protein n=1 Tax=Fusarium mexicanum TaxID=751941 RepID=A0A8H5I859_9HYPO|nr:SNF2 family domain-containing protein [Fusarium mexicanum]
MPEPNFKRPSTILDDSRQKKRAKQSNGAEGIAAQEGSALRPPERASTPPEAYDVCFGMLMVKATCAQSNLPTQECTPVTLDFEGRLLRVREQNSNRRIAVVVSNALFRLVNEFAVTLTANVCGKKPPVVYTSMKKGQTVSEMDGIKFCSLRIVIYGFLLQKDQISAILAQDELFLQHPGKNEFDRNVKYLNPHYLLPPGQNMPEVEKLTTYACCPRWSSHSRELQTSMPEHEQNQILQIFNTTYQPISDLNTIETSPRLVTGLKRHQVEALVMMIEKEAGVYENTQFPVMWVPHKSPSGDIRYQNIVTEMFKMSRPPPISGGILADEMGLGKTLSMLSLICHFLDEKEKRPDKVRDQPRATLIVTPKSTIYSWEKQIKTHIYADKIRWLTYHGFKRHEAWTEIESQDIVLTTYETLRSDRAKESPLFEHDWARVVLDEERVEIIDMGREDRRLYEFFKRFSYLTAGLDKISKKKPATNILVLISMLRLICNHGEALLPEAALKAWKERDSSVLSWEVLEANIKRCISCKSEIEESETAASLTEDLPCGHTFCSRCASKLQSSTRLTPCLQCGLSAESQATPITGVSLSLSGAMSGNASKPIPPPSAKVQALIRNISRAEKGPEGRVERPKSVVFSYWTKMLDLIGFALNSQGVKFQRIDGQSSMSQRKVALETFGSDPECNIMLASIGAAGEGIDLTSASTVHIVEPHWNPMAEAQAVDRVHRIGQQKDVYVIRYIANDSIEQYVQWMQRDKQRLIAESLSISEEKPQDVDEVRWKKLIEFLE